MSVQDCEWSTWELRIIGYGFILLRNTRMNCSRNLICERHYDIHWYFGPFSLSSSSTGTGIIVLRLCSIRSVGQIHWPRVPKTVTNFLTQWQDRVSDGNWHIPPIKTSPCALKEVLATMHGLRPSSSQFTKSARDNEDGNVNAGYSSWMATQHLPTLSTWQHVHWQGRPLKGLYRRDHWGRQWLAACMKILSSSRPPYRISSSFSAFHHDLAS